MHTWHPGPAGAAAGKAATHPDGDEAAALEYPEVYSTLLRRVVAAIAGERCLREDLLQEAAIHLWQLKSERPGQRSSWYLKSCQLHLLNFLRKGRSIDSWKHRQGRMQPPEPPADDGGEGPGADEWPGLSTADNPVLSQVSVRDILASLHRWLDPPDRIILTHLARGLSAREIASLLEMSHTAVIKRQRKIARVAVSLGCLPSNLKAPGGGRRVAARGRPSRPTSGAGRENFPKRGFPSRRKDYL